MKNNSDIMTDLNLETLRMLRKLSDAELVDIAISLSFRYPEIFIMLADNIPAGSLLVDYSSQQGIFATGTPVRFVITPEMQAVINNLTGASRKVGAIKHLRDNTRDMSLKAAKDIVEYLAINNFIPRSLLSEPDNITIDAKIVVRRS